MNTHRNLKTLASNDGFKLLTDQKEMDGGLLFFNLHHHLDLFKDMCCANKLGQGFDKISKNNLPGFIELVSINKIPWTRKALLSTDNPSH